MKGGLQMFKTTCVALVALLTVSLQAIAEPNYPANLSESAKTAYRDQYQSAGRDKAFAITSDGQHFYFTHGQKSDMYAARLASYRCLFRYNEPCLLWEVNDYDVFPNYERAAAESTEAIAHLPADIPDYSYALENTKTDISVPTTLRDGSQIHSPTPMEAPAGAKVISTRELVKLYKSEPGLVVVDALSSDDPVKETLPKASWLYGAGWSQASENDNIAAQLAKAMMSIVPNKNTPIVAYCLDYECWLSWNASLRFVAMGYSRVYWYRGGIEAWKRAKLPVVETPLTAEVW
jgi:PQQ-dependent catabolism-associated CXXCW motif protein